MARSTQILLLAFNFNRQSLKLPDGCGSTISDHTKQHCRNKQSMITPEAWTPVIIIYVYMYVCIYNFLWIILILSLWSELLQVLRWQG